MAAYASWLALRDLGDDMSGQAVSIPSGPDIVADARDAYDALRAGGLVLFPSDLGYAALSGSLPSLRRLLEAKRRPLTKRNGLVTDAETQRELHVMDDRGRAVLDMLARDFRLPIGIVAPYEPSHPLIQNMDPELRARMTYRGTVATFLNNGLLSEMLAALNRDGGFLPLTGSSANLSGTGSHYRLEDVPDAIRSIVDLTIDYGLCRYASYGRGPTFIDFTTMEVLRIGACYDVISDLLQRYFGIETPPDPGIEALPLGHLAAPLDPLDLHDVPMA